MRRRYATSAIAAVTATALFSVHGRAQDHMIEWPSYGGYQAHPRYSLAADITSTNVSRVAPSWKGPPAPALGPAVVPVAPTDVSAADAQPSGQAAFDRVCKVCHGEGARGDAGPRLVPFSREYDEVLGIVREGTGQMPPISARELPDEGVAQVVAYLKSLSQ